MNPNTTNNEAHQSMFDLFRNKNYLIHEDNVNNVNWDEILKQIASGNIQFIKNLITSNNIDINEQHPVNGKTLLIYATIIGNYDLVQVLCNFGADVHVRDIEQFDALYYATKYGQYRITELIYYRQLSGALGNDLKDIASKLYQKKRESKLIKAFVLNSYDDDHLYHMITKFMVKTIKERGMFGKDMLFYAWYFVVNDEKTKDNPLESDLFKTMMKTYTEILCNTNDKSGWKWLRRYFTTSLIWYLPHPNSAKQNINDDDDDDDADDVETVLQNTLFYELLVRVRKESKRQSDLLLKHEISRIKRERANEWKELTEYTVVTEFSGDARQDTVGCLQSEYTMDDLSEDVYPPSNHFSAKEHYDKHIYLNRLLFTANILDSMFQKDVKSIAKQICDESKDNISVTFRAGPVKTLKRSQTKVDNDYISENYPTSAKILDINRCALQFTTIQSLMTFIKIFTEKINTNKARSIKRVIRVKNGWSVYNAEKPSYTDVKINVLIQAPYYEHQMIVAEIQLLLNFMSSFKKKAHKLYGVERAYELVYNYNKLVSHVHSFKDNIGMNGTLIDLALNDDIKLFKLLWNTIQPTTDTLINYGTIAISRNVWDHSLFHVIYKNGNINTYLKNEFADLYKETIIKYIKTYVEKYGFVSGYEKDGFLDSISSKHNENDNKDLMLAKFMKQLVGSFENNSKQFKQILKIKGKEGKKTIIEALCKNDTVYRHSVNIILNTSVLNDKERFKVFGMKHDKEGPFYYALQNQYFDAAMELIKFIQSDKAVFLKVFKLGIIGSICKSKDRLSNAALRLILQNPIISDKLRQELFCYESKGITSALHKAIKDGYYENVQFILHYFGDNKKRIMKWLGATKNSLFYSPLFDADDECILVILKYLKNDKTKLLTLLQKTNKKDKARVFDEICKEKKIKSLKFLLYECAAINHGDILKLLCNKKYLKEKSSLFSDFYDGIWKTGFEIIKYFKNDRKSLFKLLSCNISDDQNLFIAVSDAVADDYVKDNITVLKWILLESPLSEYDKYKLLLYKNKEYKTALFTTLSNRDSHYTDIFLDALINKDFNPRLFIKLLSQETEKADKLCIMECRSKQSMLRILDTVLSDKKLLSVIISNKDEFRSGVTKLIEQLAFYLQFKASGSIIENKIVEMLQTLKERLNDIETAKEKINEKLKGELDEKVKDELQDKLEVLKKVTVEMVRTTQEAKTKCYHEMFEAACCLARYETVQKILENIIGDDVELLLSWLVGNKSNLMESILSQNDRIKNILNLVLLENKKITPIDAMKAFSKPSKGKISALFEAKIHHIISIMDYYKNDGDILYKLLSEKDDKKRQVFDYLCELKNDRKIEALQRLNYMKKKNVLKLLYHSFEIDSAYDKDDNSIEYSEKTFRNSCIYGAGAEIIKWAKNDRDILLQLLMVKNIEAVQLNAKYSEQTPLQLICRGDFEDFDESKFVDKQTIKLLLNDSVLHHRDKIDLILCKHCENDFGTVLHYACQYGPDSTNALEIINYFKNMNDEKTLQKMLLIKAKCDGDTCLIKAVKHGKIDVIKNVFCVINDNKTMLEILSMQNNKYETMYNVAREMSTQSSVSRRDRRKRNYDYKYEIDGLIEGYLNYLKFDGLLNSVNTNDITLFDEYTTNPFIICCKFGKYQTLRKLLKYIKAKDDEDNVILKRLLLHICENGNNGLMIALQNGYNEMVLEIFNVVTNLELKIQILSKKNFKGETILTHLSKNDNNLHIMKHILENVDCHKNIISELLMEADDDQKTCFDYADQNISQYIMQYS